MVKLHSPFNTISTELFSELTDLFYTGTELSHEEIVSAISRGQIYSKLWLVQEITKYLPNQAEIIVFGSWIGLASRLLFEYHGNNINSIINIDRDRRMELPSIHLNRAFNHRFIHADVFDVNLNELIVNSEKAVFINCSCDNIDSTERYVEEICPLAAVNALQQNNYKNDKSHLSVNSELEFKQQIKQLRNVIYCDTMKFNMYDRYMAVSKHEPT